MSLANHPSLQFALQILRYFIPGVYLPLDCRDSCRVCRKPCRDSRRPRMMSTHQIKLQGDLRLHCGVAVNLPVHPGRDLRSWLDLNWSGRRAGVGTFIKHTLLSGELLRV